MRVRILYAPPQTGYVCGSVIETADDEATALVGNDLAEETEADVTHDAPPVFYTAAAETRGGASEPAGEGGGAADSGGKVNVDHAALEAAATKAAEALTKLKAAHAKATGRGAEALAIKVAAAEKALAAANAAVAAAKGE